MFPKYATETGAVVSLLLDAEIQVSCMAPCYTWLLFCVLLLSFIVATRSGRLNVLWIHAVNNKTTHSYPLEIPRLSRPRYIFNLPKSPLQHFVVAKLHSIVRLHLLIMLCGVWCCCFRSLSCTHNDTIFSARRQDAPTGSEEDIHPAQLRQNSLEALRD